MDALPKRRDALGGLSSGHRRIDVHAHYVPENYRSALVAAGHAKPSGMPGIPAWSVELALATMDRLEIETALLSISAPGVHFGDDAAARALARFVNEEGAQAVSAHPRRFGLFAVLPLPDVDGALKEIDHAVDALHVDGVVMESDDHGTYLGDARFDPVFAELDRRDAAISIHPANPERFMYERAGSKVAEIKSSHRVLMSHPAQP